MGMSTIKDKLLETIQVIANYQEGWDGEDAKPATSKAVEEANNFVFWLSATGYLWSIRCVPNISLANDGELNFWWKSDIGVIDIGFYGDGTYTYYAKVNDREYSADDKLSKDIGRDDNLFLAISQLVNR
jgi:hypothetical protein